MWLERLRHPSPRAKRWTTLIVFVVALTYLRFTAWYQDRDMIPKFHDEHMHLVQMQMLAHGKLWTQSHPLADFFETFHVLVRPVYAAIYFPGTAIANVPAVWLRLPLWFIPWLLAATLVAMMYRLGVELLDGVAGLLAALMLISLQWFRYLSLMVMSQSLMALLGVLIILAWLRWRRDQSPRFAAIIGALMGLAAITRPADALCYSIPIAVTMLIARPKQIALVCVAALPFLAVQLIENIGITGSAFKTPYRLYADLYTPQMSFGFHRFDPSARPQTKLPQRQDYYDQFTLPAASAHRLGNLPRTWLLERFPLLVKTTLPSPLLLIFLVFVPWALKDSRLLIPASILLLYLTAYACFAYLLPMYCITIAPMMIVVTLSGMHVLTTAGQIPARRDAPRRRLIFSVIVIILCVIKLPELNREIIDDGYPTPTMWLNYKKFPQDLKQPAIVLFRYHKGDNVNEEPVYNIDAINPDDAPIIRAHDLGKERDRDLFTYYAQRQPNRTVYLFDRSTRQLVELGNVKQLAEGLTH